MIRCLGSRGKSVLPSGLVLALGLNEGSGTAAADASGSGNNGTLAAANWTASGKYGQCATFNGSSDYINVPDSASLDLTTGVTLAMWVYPTITLSGYPTLILKEDPASDLAYAIYGNNTSNRPNFNIGGKAELAGTAALTVNTWTHVAATYDGTTLRLYINGSEVANRADAGSIGTTTGPLRIGWNSRWPSGAEAYFTGRIDEVQIYNRALNASEITTAMNTPI